MPLRVFLQITHLVIVTAHELQKICPQSTSTGLLNYLLHFSQIVMGMFFSIDLRAYSISSFAAISGLLILLHLSFSVLQKSRSCYHPVLQFDLSCRQIQLSPNGQYPESCQSLHNPKLQSNLQVFLIALLTLDGPCIFLNFSSALTISSSVSAQFAQLFIPLYTVVSSFPYLMSLVVLTFCMYFCFASYSYSSSYDFEQLFWLSVDNCQPAWQFRVLNSLWSQAYFFCLCQVVLEEMRLVEVRSGFSFFWGYWRSRTYQLVGFWGCFGVEVQLFLGYEFSFCYWWSFRLRICCYLVPLFLNILPICIFKYSQSIIISLLISNLLLTFTSEITQMELPNDIKATLDQLSQNQQFLSNIAYYTKVAFDCILAPNLAEESQKQCPTPFLLALAHYVMNGLPLQNLALELPENAREQYTAAIRVLQKKLNSVPEENITMKLLNDHIGQLKDVKWQMSIENGRQVWIVELIIDNMETPAILKLNYQELSLFSFKINQVLGHIKSIDLGKVV